jgi:excisionase family DNA binding protein
MRTINPSMTPDEVTKLPALCSVPQAAELTGYSTHFLSDACARGDIKAVKFGRRWRIDTAALLRQFGLTE